MIDPQKIKINIPPKIRYVMEKLRSSGFESFIVGGSVRDAVMGLTPHDFDVTTIADTDQLQEVFKDDRTVTQGLKHGTLTVIIDNEPIEITTYRLDGDYNDHRHPDSVTFTKELKEDLIRRDFTINAMAYSDETGLIDVTGGVSDIENGILRTVGDPAKRFDEDPLRILRGLRFAGRFGFEIEKDTSDEMIRQAEKLDFISKERIYTELKGLLTAPAENLETILDKQRDVIFKVIPELKKSDGFNQQIVFHKFDCYMHAVKATCSIPPVFELRFAMLMHDIGKPDVAVIEESGRTHFNHHSERSAEIAEEVLNRLRAPTKASQNIIKYILHHEDFKGVEGCFYEVGKFIGRMGSIEDALNEVLVFRADLAAKSDFAKRNIKASIDNIEKEIYNYKNKELCYKISQLAVNGRDLIEIGITDGLVIKKLLDKMLDYVLQGVIFNEKENLLEFAKGYL